MAVYKRTYIGFEGAQTPTWSRFLIPARYNFAKLMQQRFIMSFITLSLFYPMACVVYVYLSDNPDFLASLGLPPFEVDGEFFYRFARVQGVLAYLLTAFISPGLISWDLSNGALPLYFCRPFSRIEYVMAKLAVLLPLLSILTWIPGVVLFAIKASISDWEFFTQTWWLGRGVFFGLFVWSLLLSLIGLALSACVKLRIAAGALILGLFIGGAGLGAAINSVMNIESGSLVDLMQVIHAIWADLFRYDNQSDLSVTSAWIVVGIVTAVCVWLLNRKVRTFEVIK